MFLISNIFIILILVIYILFIYKLSKFVYYNSIKYYKPLKGKNGEDLHEKNNAFKCIDKKPDEVRLFFGLFFFLPIHAFLSFWSSVIFNIHIRFLKNFWLKNPDKNRDQYKILNKYISFWSYMFLYSNGVIPFEIGKENLEKKVEEIYKKYLGDNYDVWKERKYSIITCNHFGFFETVYCMAKFGVGFIAKKELKNFWFVGPIAEAINCLFVQREDNNDRIKIFKTLEQRQKDYYNDVINSTLAIFPEGTTTNGNYCLKFKKGAFYSLLPIKPVYCSVFLDEDVKNGIQFSLAVGVQNLVISYIRGYAYLWLRIKCYSWLPVIEPTQFMWEMYKDETKEKWEIYAEIVRNIYCDIFKLIKSDLSLSDEKRYFEAIMTGTYREFLYLPGHENYTKQYLSMKKNNNIDENILTKINN